MQQAEAGAAAHSPDTLSLAARAAGIIRRPGPTCAAIVAAPRVWAMLALLFAVPFTLSALLLSTEVGRLALVDQWEQTAVAFGQTVDDARYEQFHAWSATPLPYAATTAAIRGPAAAVAISAVVFGVYTWLGAGAASYRQVLAVVAHAGVILLLRDVVAAPFAYLRESLSSPTSLVRFVGMLDEASPVARFSALIDVFVLWWLVVLAIGISVLYGRPARRVAAALGGLYLAAALALAGVMAALGATT